MPREDDMGNLVMLGEAALWFVSVYQEKEK
jgi:hypothetical protein